jgi:uncharacterized membrane protein
MGVLVNLLLFFLFYVIISIAGFVKSITPTPSLLGWKQALEESELVRS